MHRVKVIPNCLTMSIHCPAVYTHASQRGSYIETPRSLAVSQSRSLAVSQSRSLAVSQRHCVSRAYRPHQLLTVSVCAQQTAPLINSPARLHFAVRRRGARSPRDIMQLQTVHWIRSDLRALVHGGDTQCDTSVQWFDTQCDTSVQCDTQCDTQCRACTSVQWFDSHSRFVSHSGGFMSHVVSPASIDAPDTVIAVT